MLANFTVITTNDSGPGSLRQAILDANARPGSDEIDFDFSVPTLTLPVEVARPDVIGIDLGGLSLTGPGTLDIVTENDNQIAPGGEVGVIRPTTPLPVITDTLDIDAHVYSIGLVELSAPSVAIRGDLIQGPVFQLEANDSSIRGFLISAATTGILIQNGASGNVIEKNIFGDPAVSNSNVTVGVQILGSNLNAIRDNVFVYDQVASMQTTGVAIENESAGNAIEGNRISGAHNGIFVNRSGQNRVEGNVVSGARSGILVSESTGLSVLQGNRLVGNAVGVTLLNAATLVGGDNASHPNYFRRNEIGLLIERGGENYVINNRFGTNDAGTSTLDNLGNSLGNDLVGIQIENSSGNILRGNQIAGLNPNQKYGISAPTALCGVCSQPAAIRIDGPESIDNLVTGNLLGVNASGTSVLPNYGGGILTQYATQTVIKGNTISGSLDFPAQRSYRDAIAEALDTDSLALAYLGAPVFVLGDPTLPESGPPANTVTLEGNRIGTNSSGTLVLGNDLVGIVLFTFTVNGGTIGGPDAGDGNLFLEIDQGVCT